jgi:hypothetical protein
MFPAIVQYDSNTTDSSPAKIYTVEKSVTFELMLAALGVMCVLQKLNYSGKHDLVATAHLLNVE